MKMIVILGSFTVGVGVGFVGSNMWLKKHYAAASTDQEKMCFESDTQDISDETVSDDCNVVRPTEFKKEPEPNPEQYWHPTVESPTAVRIRDEKENIVAITAYEHSNDFTHYDKITITYYKEDDMLVNIEDDQVDRLELLGKYADELPNMTDNVYFRNHDYGADYEVIIENASYKEEVLGEYGE